MRRWTVSRRGCEVRSVGALRQRRDERHAAARFSPAIRLPSTVSIRVALVLDTMRQGLGRCPQSRSALGRRPRPTMPSTFKLEPAASLLASRQQPDPDGRLAHFRRRISVHRRPVAPRYPRRTDRRRLDLRRRPPSQCRGRTRRCRHSHPPRPATPAFQHSRTLPDAPLHVLETETPNLLRATEAKRAFVERLCEDLLHRGLVEYGDRCSASAPAKSSPGPAGIRTQSVWTFSTGCRWHRIWTWCLMRFIILGDGGTVLASEALSESTQAAIGLNGSWTTDGVRWARDRYLCDIGRTSFGQTAHRVNVTLGSTGRTLAALP